MARQNLFREEATLELPELTFTSRLTGEPGSNFPSGTHQNEGKMLTLTRNGNDKDNFEATYEGTLTIGGTPYKWTSREKNKVDRDGNIKGKEDVEFETQIPRVPKKIKMDTEWIKGTKTVENTGYQE
jgi:hypothetical protein